MKDTIIVGILVVLVMVSVVQATQLADHTVKMNAGAITGNAVAVEDPMAGHHTGSSNTQLPQSLQNLPGQVGGC